MLACGAVCAPHTFAQTRPPEAPADRSPRPLFRTATELVVLPVTVHDAAGRPVVDLRIEDFTVYEEGALQTVTMFETADTPLDLVLLLDTSDSMSIRMDDARDAAMGLVRELRKGDRAAVVLFSDRVHIAQPLTGDSAALEHAIRGARLVGGTALYEALYIALRDLARERREPTRFRRQALVILSDGKDTTSKSVTFDDVLAEARRSAVTVFTIMAGEPESPRVNLRNSEQLGIEYMLRVLAEETGGRAFATTHDDDLASTYSQIAVELGRQYWLAYSPGPGRSGFRRVSVHVSGPGLRARTRSGYYATSTRAAASAPVSRETLP
jgi:Ca-activated chloride channel homolog